MDLHRSGHEIACHIFSHKRAIELDAAAMSAEIETNRRYFHALDLSIRLENFAYPYGLGSVFRKAQLKDAFRSSRAILPGVNRGTVDLQFLRASPLVGQHIDREGIERAFEEAAATGGWLIFYSHEVVKNPAPTAARRCCCARRWRRPRGEKCRSSAWPKRCGGWGRSHSNSHEISKSASGTVANLE